MLKYYNRVIVRLNMYIFLCMCMNICVGIYVYEYVCGMWYDIENEMYGRYFHNKHRQSCFSCTLFDYPLVYLECNIM